MKSSASTEPFLTYIAQLHRAVHALGLYIESSTGGAVSQAEALVVLQLGMQPSSTINDVHHAFLHRRSTLTSVLDRLTAKGLVQRAPGDDDRRTVVVRLTARGRTVESELRAAFAALQHSDMPPVKPRDIALLRALAERAHAAPEEG